eukprot:7383175-Prymnesium_polylepis.1
MKSERAAGAVRRHAGIGIGPRATWQEEALWGGRMMPLRDAAATHHVSPDAPLVQPHGCIRYDSEWLPAV